MPWVPCKLGLVSDQLELAVSLSCGFSGSYVWDTSVCRWECHLQFQALSCPFICVTPSLQVEDGHLWP